MSHLKVSYHENENDNINIEPERFAPSDLSVHDLQIDLDTSHQTKLVLREKVVIIGDDRVGKSSIIRVLNSGLQSYLKSYKMTSTVELHVLDIEIPNTNITVDLFLHDIPGFNIFHQVSIFMDIVQSRLRLNSSNM